MELFNGLLAGNHWGTQRVCVCPAALRGGQILLLWAAGSLSSRIVNTFFSSLLLLAIALPWTARAEVKLGNEVLAAEHFKVLQGKRVGLLTNPSGVNRH